MPRAPKHCGHPGCPTLVRGVAYCDEHIGWKTGPRTASSDVTGTRRWKRLRLNILERDGHVCQIQTPGVCLGRATVVDKVRPAAARPDLAFDESNLRAACGPCNDLKARTVDQGRGRPCPRVVMACGRRC